MIKRTVAILVMAVLALGIGGCGKTTSAVSGQNGQKLETTEFNAKPWAAADKGITYPLILRAGYTTDETDPRGIALAKFKEDVEERTNGQIQIAIYPSGQLGSDSEIIAKMMTDEVEMTVSSAGNYAIYATKVGVSSLPFLFEDFETAWEFMDSDLIARVNTELDDYNMHVIAQFDNGFRCITTSKKAGAIKNVSDMEGLNIRTPSNQVLLETMSQLGANPRSLAFPLLKEALKDGTFDAQENPIPIIYNSGLYEVQHYLVVTNHCYDAMPLTIRNNIWKQLPDEYRTILSECAIEAQKLNREMISNQTKEYVKLLEDEGMEIVYPDLKAFKKVTEGVLYVFSGVYGEELTNSISQYIK